MVRLLVVLAIVGGLTLFALQNTTPIALTVLGISTLALPLSVWLLLAIAAGAATMLVIASLYQLSGTLSGQRGRSAPRPFAPTPGGDRAASTSTWNRDWQPIPSSSPAPNPIRDRRGGASPDPVPVSRQRTDESWETFGQPLNDDWERVERKETWEDWQDDPDPVDRQPYSSSGRSDRPPDRRTRFEEPRTYDDSGYRAPRYPEPENESRYGRSGYDVPRDEADDRQPEYEEARDRESDYGKAAYDPPRYEGPVYEEPVYEEPVYEEPVYGADRYEEPDYSDRPYEQPRVQFEGYDYTVLQDPDDEEEPEREEWDDWEDDHPPDPVPRDAQGWRSPTPEVTGPPPRTEFERPQAPRASYRSGTIYSYSYRQDDEPSEKGDRAPDDPPGVEDGQDATVQDTDYRVIIPPVRSPSEPSEPSESL